MNQEISEYIDTIKRYLEPGEEVIYLTKKGWFGGKILHVLTNQRVLKLNVKKEKVEKKPYLELGEEFVQHGRGDFMLLGPSLPGGGHFLLADELILTNQRVISLNTDSDEIVQESILLSDITYVDIAMPSR